MMGSQQMIQERRVPQDLTNMPTGPIRHAAPPPGRPAQSGPQRPSPAPASPSEDSDEHEGGTEEQVGDLTGPGAGYDDEPEKVDNDSGVAES
jgi:hypothetical protein